MLDRTTNMAGAAALAIVDRMLRSIETSERWSTALLFLARSPGARQDELGSAVALNQSSTSYLVSRLLDTGLVTRRTGSDARSVSLRLTPRGRTAAATVLAGRAATLNSLLEVLDDRDRADLERIAGKLLEHVATESTDPMRLCRLCDVTACDRSGRCPVEEVCRHRNSVAD